MKQDVRVTQCVMACDFVALIKHLIHGQCEGEGKTIVSNKLRGIKDTVRPLISSSRGSLRKEMVVLVVP